jgi:Leucine-rich repeat (LRR) protein
MEYINFDCGSNKLLYIPDTIDKLKNLTTLYFGGNNLMN